MPSEKKLSKLNFGFYMPDLIPSFPTSRADGIGFYPLTKSIESVYLYNILSPPDQDDESRAIMRIIIPLDAEKQLLNVHKFESCLHEFEYDDPTDIAKAIVSGVDIPLVVPKTTVVERQTDCKRPFLE